MWQSFVRNWVMGQLQERLGEQARRAGTDPPPGAGENPAPPQAPAQPLVCHVGVVVGQRAEAAGLIERMTGVVETLGDGFTAHEGSLAGRRVVVVVAGPEAAAASRGTLALWAGHRPQWVVAAGFFSKRRTWLAFPLALGSLFFHRRSRNSASQYATASGH